MLVAIMSSGVTILTIKPNLTRKRVPAPFPELGKGEHKPGYLPPISPIRSRA